VMIPTVLMILTYEVKQLMGISSMNQLEEHLFRDTALLKIIGFTARQIQEGFCRRGEGKRQGPMHRDTLADFLSKFSSLWRNSQTLIFLDFFLDKFFFLYKIALMLN